VLALVEAVAVGLQVMELLVQELVAVQVDLVVAVVAVQVAVPQQQQAQVAQGYFTFFIRR
jgi:hypothetical protein